MERVGLVALSIATATLLLVGASYGAQWLRPYLDDMTSGSPWPLIGFATLFPAAILLIRRRRTHHPK